MPFVAPIVAAIGAASAVSAAVAATTFLTVATAVVGVAGAIGSIAEAVQGNNQAAALSAAVATGAGALGQGAAASAQAAGNETGASEIPAVEVTPAATTPPSSTLGTISHAAQLVPAVFTPTAGTAPGGGFTIGDVLGNIGAEAEALASDIKAFADPIVQFVNETADLVKTLNDSIISPINNFIGGVNTLITQIPKEFAALATGGIVALGGFVTSLSDTLTSADAQFGRAVEQLGEHNLGTARDVLVPGLTEGIGTPLGGLRTSWVESLSGNYHSPAAFGHVDLASPPHAAEIMKQVRDVEQSLESGNELWRLLANAFLDLIKIGPAIERINAPSLNEIEQAVNASVPTELLDPSSLIRALYRGILDINEVNAEALKQGLDPTRVRTLIENALWLPGAREAVEFFYRGGFDESTLERTLEQIGLTSSFAQAIKIAMLEPIDPRESMGASGRVTAGAHGFLPSAYASPPPEGFAALYPPRFADPGRASVDWIQHWRSPDMAWWITAFFRGIRTRTEVELAATAANIPAEVIPDLIEVEQDVVQLWMIPDMLAAGIFTDQEALDYLKFIGIGDRSADAILKFGKAKKKAPAAVAAGDLAGISVGLAATMFDDGLITRDQYVEILEAHKYAPDAAALTVALAEQKNAIADRKTKANDIVNEVNAGLIAEADAVSALFALGYTDAEVAGYVLKIKQARTASAKRLSDGDLRALWKHKLIGDADALAGLTGNGWSDANAALLLALWQAGG